MAVNHGNQCHAVASWSQHGIQYAPEVCYGEPISSAQPIPFKALRKVSFSPSLSRDQIKSAEIRVDRLDGKTALGNHSVAGELAGEFSFATYDDFLEALTCGDWDADSLKVGSKRRSYFMVEHFSDINEYRQTSGMEVNTLKLSVNVNSKVGCTWGMTGADLDYTKTEFPHAQWGQPTTKEPSDTFKGEIKVDGTAVATVTSLELNANNGIEPLFVLFDKVAERSSINPFMLSGTMSAYFENETLLKKYIDSERQAIEFSLDMDGGRYTFQMPNCIFTEGNTATGAGNVPINFSFVSDHDGTSPIYITRFGDSQPVITTQPVDTTVSAGSPITLSVEAQYATEYQWEKQEHGQSSWLAEAGATDRTFTIANPQAGDNGDKYRCSVKNKWGTVDESTVSDEATITVS